MWTLALMGGLVVTWPPPDERPEESWKAQTLRRGLAFPYRFLVYDYALNASSARRLAALQPELVCFGHGEPLRDGRRFEQFVH